MIASVKEIDALNITLFNSCINFTNVHLCNYCTKIFVIIVNTCVCRRSVDNKALILILHMLDCWSKRTDANGAKVRAILFNYKIPFDLMNRRILVEKLFKLNLPTRIINWITDFLS